MRIGIITPEFRPANGGAERMAEAVGRLLAERGHHVWVLTGRWRSSDPTIEHHGRFHIVRHATLWNGLGCGRLSRLGRYVYHLSLAWQLIRRGGQWDVWQVHQGLMWAAVSVAISQWFHKPVVVSVHAGPLQFDLQAARPWCRPLILEAERLVCMYASGRQRALTFGARPEQVTIIPNGVDIQRFAPSTDAHGSTPPSQGATDVHSRSPTLICVGRLEPVKGLDVLLEAIARLQRTHRLGLWRLHVVGSGSQSQALRTLAARLGVARFVDWLGSRDEIPELLHWAYVFIQPSRSEGMSNSLLEAMASGLPCVATDVGGTREVFGYGVPGDVVPAVTQTPVGFLVPPESAESLAEAMGRLMEHPTLRRDMGVAARQRIEAAFSLEQTIQAYETLYRQLLNGAGNR